MSLRLAPASWMGRRFLTVCAAVFAAVVVLAGPASAHAELVSATPSQGAVVRGEPTQVTLRFSEEIVLRLSAVKVIGPDGRRLDAGALRPGTSGADSMAVNLAPDARHGTFVVVWQVTAADDGHASSGTVMFAVGAASTPASVAGLGHNRLTSAVYDAGQWIGFAGLAMVGGVAALHTYRRREQVPGGDGSSSSSMLMGAAVSMDADAGAGARSEHAEAAGGLVVGDSNAGLRTEAGSSGAEIRAEAGGGDQAEAASATGVLASDRTEAAGTTGVLASNRTEPAGTTGVLASDRTEPAGATGVLAGDQAEAAGTTGVLAGDQAEAAGTTAVLASDRAEASAAPASVPTWPAALGWSLLVVGTLIQVAAYAPAARGLSVGHLLDRSLLSVTVGTREGHAFMARLLVLAVGAVVGDAVLRRARGAWLPLAFTVAVAATWGATGHAATGGGAGVAMVAVTVHVTAMAVWVGGLFVVAVLLAGGGQVVGAAVGRFSRLALGAVAMLVVTGVYQGWREVGSVSGLLDTTYGRLLLAKVAILLCVIGVARRSRGMVATWRGGGEGALRRNVMVELAGASVLLLLAVLLAGNAPAR